MSLQALTYVWSEAPFEGGALLVLLALADYADEDGSSFPSIRTLAKKARLSEREVQYTLSTITEGGWVTVDRGAGPHGVNVYTIVGVQNLHRGGARGVQSTAPDPRSDPKSSISRKKSGGSDRIGSDHSPYDRFILRS